MNQFKGNQQSWDHNSKMKKEKCSHPPGIEPLSPGTENQCANNGLHSLRLVEKKPSPVLNMLRKGKHYKVKIEQVKF